MPQNARLALIAIGIACAGATAWAVELVPQRGPAPLLAALAAKDEIPSKLKNDLRSKYEKDRAGAVKKLAAIGTEEAWGLVLRALEDVKGQVADEAQKWLSDEICPPEVWARLLEDEGLRHRDGWVRLRAAEVLGRVRGPVPAEELLRALDKKEIGPSLAALRALESLQARGALDWGKNADKSRSQGAKTVGKLLRADAQLASQALLTWVELDTTRALEAASKVQDSKEPLLRAAALRVQYRAKDPRLLQYAAAALQDEDGGVRGVAQRTLQEIGSKPALLLLVQRIEVEPREKLLLDLLPRLQAMTGYKAGRQASAWLRYAEDLPADWSAVESAAAEPNEWKKDPDGEDESRANDAGLPTFSDRIVYLMDFSGSIWNVRPDGKTRKELLDPIFDRTLDALAENTRFNLGPYTGEVKAWQKSLVDAEARKVKDAHRFIDEIRITGPGDFYAAVEWAKSDPEIDTICVLTDGAPSGGRRWDMQNMVDLLLEENRLRPIRYDVVLVDASKGLTRHWQRLVDATGGTLRTVQFD